MKNRKKRRAALVTILSLCMILNGTQVTISSAAESTSGTGESTVTDEITPKAVSEAESESNLVDENQNKEYAAMDENGNITEAEPTDGTIPEKNTSDSVSVGLSNICYTVNQKIK